MTFLGTQLLDTTPPYWMFAIALIACILLAAQFFVFGKRRAVVIELLGLFFAISLALDSLWYARMTHSLRDESRLLGEESSSGQFLLGRLGHELALENQCLPIWPPWQKTIPMNQWFLKKSEHTKFLYLEPDHQNQGSQQQDTAWDNRFPSARIRELHQTRLFHDMRGDNYQLLARLYLINADGASPSTASKYK